MEQVKKCRGGIIKLSRCNNDDCQFVFALQTQANSRKYFLNPQIPTWYEHKDWFEKSLKRKDFLMWKVTNRDISVGFIRVKLLNNFEADISILINEEYSNQGLGKGSLALLFQEQILINKRLLAIVNKSNQNSIRLFSSVGFKATSEKDELIIMEKRNCH